MPNELTPDNEDLGDQYMETRAAQESAGSDDWLREFAGHPETTATEPAKEPPKRMFVDDLADAGDFILKVGKDVGKGVVVEGVPQFASGAIDAFNNVAKSVGSFTQWLYEKQPDSLKQLTIPSLLGITKKDGSPIEPRDMVVNLPNWKDADTAKTVTGEMMRAVGEYVGGSAIVGPVTKAIGIPPSRWKLFVDDFIVGSTAMDFKKMNSALELLPEGPVRDFMVAKPEQENELIERMKSGGLTSLGGVAFEGLVRGLRVLKGALKEGETAAASTPVGTPPKDDALVVAARNEDGKLIIGKPGQIHPDLLDQGAADTAEMGFADSSGAFLTRQEAAKRVGQKEPLEANSMFEDREATALGNEPDSVKPLTDEIKKAGIKDVGKIPEDGGVWTLKDKDGKIIGGTVYRVDKDENLAIEKTFFRDGASQEDRQLVAARFKSTNHDLGSVTEPEGGMNKAFGIEEKPKRDFLIGDPVAPTLQWTPEALHDADTWLARFQSVDANGAKMLFDNSLAKLNFEVIGGPDDFLQAVNDVAAFTRSKKVETVGARQEIARNVSIPIDDLVNGRNGWGQALDQYQVDALGWAFRQAGEQMVNTARAAVESGDPMSKAKALRMFMVFRNIQEFAEGARSTAGRTLAAWKTFADEATGQNAKAVKELLDNIGGNDSVDDILQKLADLDNAADAGALVQKAAKANSRQMFLNGWYNILLSNPSTHSANIAGNLSSILTHVVDRAVAARLGDGNGIQVGEAAAFLHGLFGAAKDATTLAFKGLMRGQQTFGGPTPVEIEGSIIGGRAYRSEVWRTNGQHIIDPDQPLLSVSNLVNAFLPTKWLGAEDDFFKWTLYRAELRAQAFRDGMGRNLNKVELENHIQSIMANPSPAIDSAATMRALEGTFNQPMTRSVQGLAQFFDAMNLPVPHTSLQIPVGRILLPFIRTPANLIKWSYDHSPFSYMFPSSRVEAEWAAGGASRDLAKAKIITGSLVAGSVAELVLSGTIDGGGPSDPNLNRAWRAAGHEPYTFGEPGGPRHSYRRLSPVGDVIGLTADGVEIMQYMTEKASENLMTAILFAWTNNFLNKTFFSSINGFFRAVQDPVNAGGQFMRNLGSSSVPNVVSKIAEIQDPYVKMSYDIVDKLKAETPGLNPTLPRQVDHFGRDIPIPGATMNVVSQMVSPVALIDKHPEPIDKFLWDQRVGIQKPPRVQPFSINGMETSIELTPQQYHDFLKLAGNDLKAGNGMGAKDMLNALVEGKFKGPEQEIWNRATNEAKVEIVKDVMAKYRKNARIALLKTYPEGLLEVVKESVKEKAKALDPTIGGGLK